MGELLNEFKTYGYREAIENMLSGSIISSADNGHNWLIQEQARNK